MFSGRCNDMASVFNARANSRRMVELDLEVFFREEVRACLRFVVLEFCTYPYYKDGYGKAKSSQQILK